MSDLFITAAKLHAENGKRLLVQKRHDSGDLFKSAWSLQIEHEASLKPKLSKRSVFTVGLEKYSPDQPRDDQGQWTEIGGGGSSGGATIEAIAHLNTVARGVKPGDSESAERFLEAARTFAAEVREGEIKPTPSQWQEALSPAGKVLERVAQSVEVVALSAGAGVAVSALAGGPVGAAVAGLLGASLIYDEYANNRTAMRSREEARRLRDNMQDLERALAQLKAQRYGGSSD